MMFKVGQMVVGEIDSGSSSHDDDTAVDKIYLEPL